ncbi:MAG: DUF58 domain-containing protein [Deltaproteobacteria bacterium]|nr:MAG: DUF58 domain-containing protein [Deltaproteobacteria bacterium]
MSLTAEELRELRRVHLAAGRRVDSLLAGEYRAAVRGQGMEFEEVRAYVPGDDVRHIDWNVTARTGEPFIKVFREERQLTVQLLVDCSGSTRVGSGGRDGRTLRRLQIARVAGGIAYASIRNRDQLGLVTFTDRIERYLPPRTRRGHVWAVIQAVYEAIGERRGTDIEAALAFLARTQRRRSVVILVSDFLDDGDWPQAIARLSRRHEVHALVVHDPLDHQLSGLGLVEVVDAETGQVQLVDGASWAGKQAVGAVTRELIRRGARVSDMSTHDDPFKVLQQHFQRVGARR